MTPPNRPTTEEIASIFFEKCTCHLAIVVKRDRKCAYCLLREALDTLAAEKDAEKSKLYTETQEIAKKAVESLQAKILDIGGKMLERDEKIRSLEIEIAKRDEALKWTDEELSRLRTGKESQLVQMCHSLKAELKEAKESRQRVMTADAEIIAELQAEVKRFQEFQEIVGADISYSMELRASLSLAVGALKKIQDMAEDIEANPDQLISKMSGIADDAIHSPAIQKEVQRIEAMERVVGAAIYWDKAVPDGISVLSEAIKTYEGVFGPENS